MSAEPLTREERERDTILCQQRWIARPNARDGYLRRYEATVQAAEERAERLRAVIARNVDCAHYAGGCDCASELRDALAADDAARGEA